MTARTRTGRGADPAVDWLLDGDPAIRWQARRDLLDAAPSTIAPRAPLPRQGVLRARAARPALGRPSRWNTLRVLRWWEGGRRARPRR